MVGVARRSWPAARTTDMMQVVLRIRSGPTDIGREFELSETVTRIGRGQDNDIVLDDRKLSRFHASIERVEDGLCSRI
jgi:pSer/pThr/pTyr-binding forkhead associated (FHA) protein